MPTRCAAAGAAVLLMLGSTAAGAKASTVPLPDPVPALTDAPIEAPVLPPPDAPDAPAPGTEIVEIVLDRSAGADTPVPASVTRAVAAAGGQVVGAETGSVLLVEVPVGTADELNVTGAEVREPVHMNVPLQASAQAPAYGTIPGDSAAAIGALDWQAAGYDGTGVRIGVIDFFNMTFWNVAEMGPQPTAANGRAMCRFDSTDCIADFNEAALPGDPTQHGPAVVEVIRDVAPNADIFIASAESYSDYIEVLDWFAANGVTIISRSLGTFLDGPGDGRGPTAELADYAVGKGMVWLNAAGNEGNGGYWRGPASGPTISGGYVALNPAQNETWMKVSGCTIAALRWNDFDTAPAQRSDYDLEVWRGNDTQPLLFYSSESSQLDQRSGSNPADPIEQLDGSCGQGTATTYLRVKYGAGPGTAGDVLEILDYQGGLQYHQAPYSAALPAADSSNPSVLAIGAVDPVGGTAIAPYSSQGPTNDGRVKPDIVAPSGVHSSVYGTFQGTSASTPAVAGAAALLLQSGLASSGPPLAALLRSSVLPLGTPVPNSVYGAGLLRLPAVPAAPGLPPPTAYHPLPEPLRIVDTRPTSPVGPASLTGKRDPGTILDVAVESLLGRTAGSVAAVALNLTVVDAAVPGWAQVVPTQRATLGAYSNLNLDAAGQTRSNVVQVPVGANGSISVYVGSGGFTLVDVLGTYEYDGSTTAAGRFTALDPARVLDTRAASRIGSAGSGPNGALRRGEAVCVDTSAAGIDTSGIRISALVLNVTATDVSAAGYVQALPTGGSLGSTSTLNLVPGATVANTTIVPLGAACGSSPRSASVLFDAGDAGASAQLIVDVTGYITGGGADSSEAGLFVPLTPGRVLDSRPVVLASSAARTVQITGAAGPSPAVPDGATGIAANLTATSTTGWGYLTAWPSGGAVPATSSLNWSAAGATIANGAIVKLAANGALDLRSVTPGQASSAAHLLDVFGYYT